MEGRKDILEHQTGRQAGTLQPLPHFTLKSPVLYCFLIYSETNVFSHFKISEIRMFLTVNVTLQSTDRVFPPPRNNAYHNSASYTQWCLKFDKIT